MRWSALYLRAWQLCSLQMILINPSLHDFRVRLHHLIRRTSFSSVGQCEVLPRYSISPSIAFIACHSRLAIQCVSVVLKSAGLPLGSLICSGHTSSPAIVLARCSLVPKRFSL